MKNTPSFSIYSLITITALFILASGCKKEELKVPVLTTTIATAITSTTVTSGGNVTSNGGATITARGVCWSTTQNPTISDSKTSNATGTDSFVSNITGLLPGTTYYIRAYATNSVGTGYGNQVTIVTTITLPVLTTTVATVITESTATSGGNITSEGGSAVWARGVCWSTSQNPTITDSKTINGTGLGIFTSAITGLLPGTLYYIRAYAMNAVGTVYGDQVTATTLASLPTITTTALSAITTTTATGGGNITSDGGGAVTERGICWSVNQTPTVADTKASSGTGTGVFTCPITGLLPGTTYYVRAYAINSAGTVYGNQVTGTTTIGIPIITTTAITAIAQTTATSGGNVSSDGGSAVFARGVCWSTSQNPTITDNKTINGTGTGTFVSSITGLTPGATYYVRAYSTNSIGTAYGTQLTLTALATAPTVTTTAVTAITETTATTGGNVTSDGGAAITARGVCWGVNQNPTIADSKTTNGTGTGEFVSSITDLTPGRNYFIRAYATNSFGTSYGNQIPISTLSQLATIVTTGLSAITSTTASCGGYISYDGGSNITARGICWNTAQNPTIANFTTLSGTGVGTFTGNLTVLLPGTTYYVKAFATNSAGTNYGAQVTLVTSTSMPVITTTAATALSATNVTSGGNISSDGGLTVTERGVCWSTSANPTIADSRTSDGTGAGIFTSSITDLVPLTTYYIRAYATNSLGTAYGAQVTITTSAFLPILTTTEVTAITTMSATTGGTITNDGGAEVTSRGVCWSTSSNPTIAGSKTSNGTGTGAFTSILVRLDPGVSYYVRAYATSSVGTNYGNQVIFSTLSALSTVTTSLNSFTFNTATISGNVINGGNTTVTERGIYYGTSTDPVTTGTKLIIGSGTGVFSTTLQGLAPNIPYYVTAYAINSVGTTYANEVTFTLWFNQAGPQATDFDNNTYNSVKLGDQIWMTENLKTTSYSNGDAIGTTTTPTLDISGETSPKYQWIYADNLTYLAAYGRLYTWFAITDNRGVCPTGWHIPTHTAWETLANYLGGRSIAAEKLKEIGVAHWQSPNSGSNTSGFTALPGGMRYYITGAFTDLTNYGFWWSVTEQGTSNAWCEKMESGANTMTSIDHNKKIGLSVRCIKD